MRSTALHSILRTRAPRRLASTSSSPPSAENAASTAQKKAQDALGAASTRRDVRAQRARPPWYSILRSSRLFDLPPSLSPAL